MAKNRKNQAAEIRFGPALKALFLCLLIAGSAVGYVWQKSQVCQLGKQLGDKEKLLAKLKQDNQTLHDRLADLGSPVKLDQRARNLGLFPPQPGQVVRLSETPSDSPEGANPMRRIAGRLAVMTTQ